MLFCCRCLFFVGLFGFGFCLFGFCFGFLNKLSPFVFWSLDFSTATLLSSLIPGDL